MVSPSFHLILLTVSIFIRQGISTNVLNCEFNNQDQCCWYGSGNHLNNWRISNTSLLHHDYQRIFRTEKFKDAPEGNYLTLTLRANETNAPQWVSCAFCSQSGLITIRLRAWQSPTARLLVCWRLTDQRSDASLKSGCVPISRWLHSQYTISRFSVPRSTNIQLYLQMLNQGSRSKAMVIVDRILLYTKYCTNYKRKHQSTTSHNSSNVISGQVKAPSVVRKVPSIAPISPSVPRTPIIIAPKLPARARIAPIAKIFRESKSQKVPSTTVSSVISNPLNDIFGEDFANFLSEDYNSIDESPTDLNYNSMSVQTSTQSAALPIMVIGELVEFKPRDVLSDILSGEFMRRELNLKCDTKGGCLFDKSMCFYRNSHLANQNHQFSLISVKNQQFIQANIPPGGTAIIETDTYFDVPHRILFDYLEFNDGQTLSICCLRPFFEPYELFCPFISESRSSPIMWRTQRVTCPVGTIKIMFICENFGRQAGSCSIDNVRLHKANDLLDLEPCQKDLLRSL